MIIKGSLGVDSIPDASISSWAGLASLQGNQEPTDLRLLSLLWLHFIKVTFVRCCMTPNKVKWSFKKNTDFSPSEGRTSWCFSSFSLLSQPQCQDPPPPPSHTHTPALLNLFHLRSRNNGWGGKKNRTFSSACVAVEVLWPSPTASEYLRGCRVRSNHLWFAACRGMKNWV